MSTSKLEAKKKKNPASSLDLVISAKSKKNQMNNSGLEVSPVPFHNEMTKFFFEHLEFCILQR